MKLVAMMQVFNEVANGNLIRALTSLSKYCDNIVIYDDGSTDNPWEIYSNFNCAVLQSKENNFKDELAHKQLLLSTCQSLGADWILRMDADEVIEPCGEDPHVGIRRLCETTEYDSWAFHMVNLWRNESYYRIDNSFNDVVFNRLWRNKPDLSFDVRHGLHLTNYPRGATDNESISHLEVIHYGFASDEAVLDKYHMYKYHGQTGSQLDRLINESSLRVKKTKDSWFHVTPPEISLNDAYRSSIASFV